MLRRNCFGVVGPKRATTEGAGQYVRNDSASDSILVGAPEPDDVERECPRRTRSLSSRHASQDSKAMTVETRWPSADSSNRIPAAMAIAATWVISTARSPTTWQPMIRPEPHCPGPSGSPIPDSRLHDRPARAVWGASQVTGPGWRP